MKSISFPLSNKLKTIFLFAGLTCFFTSCHKDYSYEGGISAFVEKDSYQIKKAFLYGGAANDRFSSSCANTDGTTVFTGQSESIDQDVHNNHGDSDGMVIKTDENGNIVWSKLFGGSGYDELVSILRTSDGYLLFGTSDSNDGDIMNAHGSNDLWMMKIDFNGNKTWSKSYGGSNSDVFQSVIVTPDGGYVMVGYTGSADGDITINRGGKDGLAIKVDANGNIIWSKTYGGTLPDYLIGSGITAQGDFILCGYTLSMDGDLSTNVSMIDGWVLKLDRDGNKLWSKNFGGTAIDALTNVITSADGNIYIMGQSQGNDGDVTGHHGDMDGWILKINTTGNKLWSKLYGGSAEDEIYAGVPTSDGKLLLLGTSKSQNGDAGNNNGDMDAWIIKINADGNRLYYKQVGGIDMDGAVSINCVKKGVYQVSAFTQSRTGDFSSNHGNFDAWAFKLESD